MLNTLSSSLLRTARARVLLSDVGVAVVFACVIWTYSFTYEGSVGDGARTVPSWAGWHLLIPALAVVLVGVRRLAPLPVLLGSLALDWYDRERDIASEPFSVALSLFTIASQRSGRQTAAAGLVALSVLVASTQLIGRTDRGFWICLIVYSFGVVAGLAVRRIEADRWRVLRLLSEARVERREARRVQERAALAREVHDVCSNSLAVTHRLAEAASARLWSEPEVARELLDEVAEVARSGLMEVRRFVRMGEGDPVEGDLDAMLARVRAVGMPLTATVVGQPADHRLAVAVHRILQEALTNVLRHAEPTEVTLDVRYGRAGGVSVSVVNDGVVPSIHEPGRGTRGMAERVAALGGELSAAPGRVEGTWRVDAVIPPPDGVPGTDELASAAAER